MQKFALDIRRVQRFAAVVAAVALLSGCYWLRYHDLMRTHVDLMEGMAVDAGTALRELPAGTLGAGDIERLRYPLERAQQFAAISRRRYPDRVSLARFDAFLKEYAELHGLLDRLRVAPLDDSALTTVSTRVEAIGDRARAVRSAIEAETG